MKHIILVLITCLLPTLAGCGEGDKAASGAQAEPTAEVVLAEPSPPPGWQLYSYDAFSVSLPGRYVGGPTKDDATFAAIRILGQNCDDVADLIEPLRDTFAFVSVDGDTCAGSVASVQIVEIRPGPGVVSPQQFVESFRPGLPATAEFLDWVEERIGDRQAAVMQVRRNYGTFSTTQKLYAVRGGDVWFMVVVAALPADFEAAVTGYDEIARTLRVN